MNFFDLAAINLQGWHNNKFFFSLFFRQKTEDNLWCHNERFGISESRKDADLLIFFERFLSSFALKEPPLYGKTYFQAFLNYCLVIQYISFKFLSSSMSALFWDSRTCTRFSRHCKDVQIKYLCYKDRKILMITEGIYKQYSYVYNPLIQFFSKKLLGKSRYRARSFCQEPLTS